MVAIARPVVFADVLPKVKARTFALVIGFALLTALLAQVKIGLGFTPVPITGTTLGVLLAGAVLGSRMGALSIALYVVMGLFLPFYSGGTHGWDVATGATGGYLIGMIVAAFLIGHLAERHQDRDLATSIPAMIFGSVVIYVFGALWLSHINNLSIQRAVELGVTPFLIGDAIKSVIAGVALPVVWKYTKTNSEEK